MNVVDFGLMTRRLRTARSIGVVERSGPEGVKR